ncbi:TPA: hypothetical protein ACXPYP_002278 [Klebsiella pneumoniae]
MKSDNEISLYISIGGFLISCLGFINTIRQARNSRRIEKLRVYDKIYYDVCDLLLFDYKLKFDAPYQADDKVLERAVNEYAGLHWLEQMYSSNEYDYTSFESEEEKIAFHKKVSEEYNKYCREKSERMNVNQSPVMHLDDKEFRERFDRVMTHIKENLSFFSSNIRKAWDDTTLRSPSVIKRDYLALERVNMYACEEIEETIDDPYLKIFFSIRKEHRELNMTKGDMLGESWFKLKWFFLKRYYNFKYKRPF